MYASEEKSISSGPDCVHVPLPVIRASCYSGVKKPWLLRFVSDTVLATISLGIKKILFFCLQPIVVMWYFGTSFVVQDIITSWLYWKQPKTIPVMANQLRTTHLLPEIFLSVSSLLSQHFNTCYIFAYFYNYQIYFTY